MRFTIDAGVLFRAGVNDPLGDGGKKVAVAERQNKNGPESQKGTRGTIAVFETGGDLNVGQSVRDLGTPVLGQPGDGFRNPLSDRIDVLAALHIEMRVNRHRQTFLAKLNIREIHQVLDSDIHVHVTLLSERLTRFETPHARSSNGYAIAVDVSIPSKALDPIHPPLEGGWVISCP